MEMIDVLKKLQEIAETKPELVKDAVENVEKTNPKAVTEGGMKDRLKLDCLEEMSCIISAALHDFQHPGVNNVFLVNMTD